MTALARQTIRDFGFDSAESPYHFALVVGTSKTNAIRIEERFSFGSKSEGAKREPVVKAVLDQYRWTRIEAPVRVEFSHRLLELGLRSASWNKRETLLAPHLGKEITLLAWAIEDADPTVIPNVIANWRGLAPEERWWLYTTVNATSGHPEHGRDRGWRKAIKIALAENPAIAVSPGAIWISEHEAKQPERVTRRSGKTSRRPSGGSEQLTLIEGSGNGHSP
jgi:hypothetical protein